MICVNCINLYILIIIISYFVTYLVLIIIILYFEKILFQGIVLIKKNKFFFLIDKYIIYNNKHNKLYFYKNKLQTNLLQYSYNTIKYLHFFYYYFFILEIH